MTDGTFGVRADNLRKDFALQSRSLFGAARRVTAVDGVSFAIERGTTFGLVGESGSGKTTIARMLLKLEKPTSGTLRFNGADIHAHDAAQAAEFRTKVQAVFQDPASALNPRMRVDRIVAEPLEAQGASRAVVKQTVAELFEEVGLSSTMLTRYPHEFSGGQSQRIAIARALSTRPELLVLDEPVSALDVSIRAQILMLLHKMQQRLNLTYLFIGHDLAVVRYLSKAVGVMYLGRLVESGPSSLVLKAPLHPYTQRLVAVASGKTRLGEMRLVGEMPSPLDPPSGCGFRTRCPFADEQCRQSVPAARDAGGGQTVMCHHYEAIRAGSKPATGPLTDAA